MYTALMWTVLFEIHQIPSKMRVTWQVMSKGRAMQTTWDMKSHATAHGPDYCVSEGFFPPSRHSLPSSPPVDYMIL